MQGRIPLGAAWRSAHTIEFVEALLVRGIMAA